MRDPAALRTRSSRQIGDWGVAHRVRSYAERVSHVAVDWIPRAGAHLGATSYEGRVSRRAARHRPTR
jgi:hypothetical protein